MEALTQFTYALAIASILAVIFPLTINNKYGDNFMSKIDLKSIKKAYGTDLSKELEGVWFNSSVVEGLKFLIAKSGNPAYEKMARKLYKPYTKQLRKGIDLPKSVTDDIANELVVETLLLGWDGMPGDDGIVAFSKEEAMGLLKDAELKELRSEIMDFSEENARYQLDFDEEIEKN